MRTRHVSYILYLTYNSFSEVGERDRSGGGGPRWTRRLLSGMTRSDPKSVQVRRTDLHRGPPQRSIRPRTFASRRGGTSANFGRQAPRLPADFGRHGAVHDDRDGPAGEPSEDAPSGESEGRDACGDGGGEARSHGGSRPPRERLSPRSGVRGGASDQSVRPAGPHGPSRRSGAVRIREERELAAHDPPLRLGRGEGEAARGPP